MFVLNSLHFLEDYQDLGLKVLEKYCACLRDHIVESRLISKQYSNKKSSRTQPKPQLQKFIVF